MFFMMGITQGRKDLPFTQTVICDRCGQYGRYREVGRQIERGMDVEIRPGDLEYMGGQNPYSYSNYWNNQDYDNQPEMIGKDDSYITVIKRCPNCGFSTEEDYEYCPKCGSRLE